MAEEIFKNFDKGLNSDHTPLQQPKGTYTNALNLIRRKDGTPFNENGTTPLVNIPTGLEVIGSVVLEEEIIYFLTDDTDSAIGVLKSNDEFEIIVNDPILNFNKSNQIDVTAKKNFKSDRIVIFTDNGRNPPRYLNLDDADLDNFDLFITYNLPQIELDSVNEYGSLSTGIYSFAVRLLTSTTNSTAFSFTSGIVPIVDEIKSGGRDNYDGALPQTPTSKSISLSITNVDTNFDFIEIAAITYNGLTNDLQVDIVGRLPIQGRSTIPFTYSSEDQKIEELNLADIVQEFPLYNGAKCIEQKDGVVFLSNLTAEDVDIDFQKVANELTIKYVVKEVDVPYESIDLKARIDLTNAFAGPNLDGPTNGQDIGSTNNTYNDFKNEVLTFDSKSYMREEPYSFAIVPIFTNGSVGGAYHIPAPDTLQPMTIEVSGTQYVQLNFTAPLAGVSVGDNVMVVGTTGFNGTYRIQSIVGNNLITDTPFVGTSFPTGFAGLSQANTTTKILGTYYSTSEYPDGQDYPIGTTQNLRHHRMPTLSQEPHFINTGTGYKIRILGIEIEGFQDALTVLGDDAERVVGYVIVRQARNDNNRYVLTQGIAQPLGKVVSDSPSDNYYVSPVTGKYPWYSTQSTPVDAEQGSEEGAKLIAFYSPETTIYKKSILGATAIKPVMNFIGDNHLAWGKFDADAGKNDNFWHSLLNYKTGQTIDKQNFFIESSTVQYISPDSGAEYATITPTNVPIDILTDSTNGFLFFKTTFDLDTDNAKFTDGRPEFMYYDTPGEDVDIVYLRNNADASEYFVDPSMYDEAAQKVTSKTSRYLYNIVSNNANQYGEIYDAEYILVGAKTMDLDQNAIFYNGDTFIGKVAIDVMTRRRGTPENNEALQEKYFTTNYFFVESEINVNYRHYIPPAGGFTLGTIPYYPKYKAFYKGDGTGMYEIPATFGHSTGYNKQYSFENSLKKFFPRQLGQVTVTEFPNRTIYSGQSVEGEQFDANRLFLTNNYYDLPKHKGEIVDTFVFANSFYIHTSQSLWKAFVNETTTQSTSEGEVNLGKGGIFDRPSVEITTVNGGYAGTQSQWAGVNTPMGRFFIDNIQGKAFLLADGLEEISDHGMFKYFLEYIQPTIDNPTNGLGYISWFDYRNKRWLLTNTSGKLKEEYQALYKGEWRDDPEFLNSLSVGDIVLRNGKYMIYNG